MHTQYVMGVLARQRATDLTRRARAAARHASRHSESRPPACLWPGARQGRRRRLHVV
jgi:hypothetical protein